MGRSACLMPFVRNDTHLAVASILAFFVFLISAAAFVLLNGCSMASQPGMEVLSPGQAAAETAVWVLQSPSNRRFEALPSGVWRWSQKAAGLNGTTFWIVRREFRMDPTSQAPYSPLPRG